MKYQVLFSLKNNEKVFINVVCCSRNWHFKGYQNKLFVQLCKVLVWESQLQQPELRKTATMND